MTNWMLYGAYGYSGKLIVAEAIKRGHKPIIAGRDAQKLAQLASETGLESRAFSLDDTDAIHTALADVDIMLHAAGPFIHTSNPMIRACLHTNTHYLDITGEVPVFENTFTYDERAKDAGIVLISGVGFDVVPTDCMARFIAEKIPDAHTLEIAFAAISKASAGTTKSAVELIDMGGFVRRDGVLTSHALGDGARQVRFNDKARDVMPITWGDLSTAFRTTEIPNITTYMAFPKPVITMSRWFGGIFKVVMSSRMVKNAALWLVDKTVDGPDDASRVRGSSHVWVCAKNDSRRVEAWLETSEGYTFTAGASVRVVEKLAEMSLTGATTPALAFGADFVLEIPGSERFEQL